MGGSSQQRYQLWSPVQRWGPEEGSAREEKGLPSPRVTFPKIGILFFFNQNHQLICILRHLAPQSSRCSAVALTNFNRIGYSDYSRGMGTRQTASEPGVRKDIHPTGFLEPSNCWLASTLGPSSSQWYNFLITVGTTVLEGNPQVLSMFEQHFLTPVMMVKSWGNISWASLRLLLSPALQQWWTWSAGVWHSLNRVVQSGSSLPWGTAGRARSLFYSLQQETLWIRTLEGSLEATIFSGAFLSQPAMDWAACSPPWSQLGKCALAHHAMQRSPPTGAKAGSEKQQEALTWPKASRQGLPIQLHWETLKFTIIGQLTPLL